MYDVVIVGGGLAGLRAASLLRDRKLLLLEAGSSVGGRVLTRAHAGIPYDLGAVFASAQGGIAGDASVAVPASRGYALHTGGHCHIGESPLACIREALGASSEAVAAADSLAMFLAGGIGASDLHPSVRSLVNAFFQVIHPSDIASALSARQRTALSPLTEGFRDRGNVSLVDALLQDIPALAVRTGATVDRVMDEGAWVKVEYRLDGSRHAVRARHVIVATAPEVATRLLAVRTPEVDKFLNAVRFHPGLSCVVAFPLDAVAEFNYRVATDLPFNTVIQCRRNGLALLHIYFLRENAEILSELDPAAVADRVIAMLVAAGVVADARVACFFDMQFWQGIGPAVSVDAYGDGSVPFIASGRVALAGDYTWLEPANPLPFGMGAALNSGIRAARIVQSRLADSVTGAALRHDATAEHVAPVVRLPPLLHSSVFRLTNHEPRFLRHVAEGDVAYYGLLLSASRDLAIHQYLLDNARDGLWEFHAGFGATAADSALVIEGLLAVEGGSARVQASLERLVTQFYSPVDGAFRTVNGGRASYWEGVSVETTAHVAWLLHQVDALRWQAEIGRCIEYVLGSQCPDGEWNGRWFPSVCIPTFYALRLLALRPDVRTLAAISRAGDFLRRQQFRNGSFSNLVIDTSAAALALAVAGVAGEAGARARAWLEPRLESVTPGELVLYYWYDDAGERTFFVARDYSGRIARAWARLALA